MNESSSAPVKFIHIEDPDGVGEMVGRLAGDTYKQILWSKYENTDLVKEVGNNSPQLDSQQQNDLITLLKK